MQRASSKHSTAIHGSTRRRDRRRRPHTSRGFSRRRRDIDDRHYRKSRCACPAEPGCREITKPPQQRNSLSQPIRDEGGRVFGNGARQERRRRPSRATKKEVLKMKRSPSPRRSNIDGGGEGPSFEGKTIFLSSKEKEKKKKISFSSKEEENEDDHGQSGGDVGRGGVHAQDAA